MRPLAVHGGGVGADDDEHGHRSEDERRRKRLLITSVTINLGILCTFKYANFFAANVNALLTATHLTAVNVPAIALPIGISFFTFHAISYIVDIYRGQAKPMRSVADYTQYMAFFPQLFAFGPELLTPREADILRSEAERETSQLRTVTDRELVRHL